MKKELLIASALTAFSVFALDSNQVSFLPLSGIPEGADGLKLLTVPFNGCSTGDSASVAVADVLLTDGLANNDKLYIPTSTKGTYNSYTFNGSTWVADKVVTVGASIVAGSADSPAVATIARGSAFWLKTAATSVKLLGQAATQTQASKETSVGYQLLAPTTSENDILISSLAGGKGDVVILANGTKYQYNGTAGYWTNKNRKQVTDADKIPAGVGFWYKAAEERTLSL